MFTKCVDICNSYIECFLIENKEGIYVYDITLVDYNIVQENGNRRLLFLGRYYYIE